MLRMTWVWDLAAAPEALWPLVSDTDRFNRDTGLPRVLLTESESGESLAYRRFGWVLRWREEPFEWVRPRRFGVIRDYGNGPLKRMEVRVFLEPLPTGGTRLRYETALELRFSLFATLFTPLFRWLFDAIIQPKFGKVMRHYDNLAEAGRQDHADMPGAARVYTVSPEKTFAPSGKARLQARFQDLLLAGTEPRLAGKLLLLLEDGDDGELARMRPYALARAWGEQRRETLELFLWSARAGLVDFRWDLLCPSCRGTKFTAEKLRDIHGSIHCDACHIDFNATFDQSVEVTFTVNRSIRVPGGGAYCLGSPQRTPHVHLRQKLTPGQSLEVQPLLEPGRYRLRSPDLEGFWPVLISPGGSQNVTVDIQAGQWPSLEAQWETEPRMTLRNSAAIPVTFVLERQAWADDAATAAEVTAMQSFRDLFADEALRPGEEVSVGQLAFLFTDLRGSTKLYRAAGDAKAFGLVMGHFDLLKGVIAEQGGAVVKTIGDAVMAVFPRPQSALLAAIESHRRLQESTPMLVLKAGVHCGACIAVNQNDRLDYFGSTLNLSARLLGFSEGGDSVVTQDVLRDPETAAWLKSHGEQYDFAEIRSEIRGFEEETFTLTRISVGKVTCYDM